QFGTKSQDARAPRTYVAAWRTPPVWIRAGRDSLIRDHAPTSGHIDRLFSSPATHPSRSPGGRVARLHPGALRMTNQTYVVAVIEDDEILRETLRSLLIAHDYPVE